MRLMLKKSIWNILALSLVIVLPGWGRVDAVVASGGLLKDINPPMASHGVNSPEVGPVDAIDSFKSAFTLGEKAATTVTFQNNSGAPTKLEFTLSNISAGWNVTLADSFGPLKLKPNSHFESNETVATGASYNVRVQAVVLDPGLTEGNFTEPVLAVYPPGGAVSDSCQLRFAIPSPFVYAVSDSQRRNSLRLAYLSPNASMEAGELLSFAGNNLAVSAAMVGVNKYVLAWENRISSIGDTQNVEFSIFDHVGGALLHRKKLFDNTSTSNVDSFPYVAASPNGKFGILFIRKTGSSYKMSFQLVNQDGSNVNGALVPLEIRSENNMLFSPHLVGLPVQNGQYRMLAVWNDINQELWGAGINITDNNISIETSPKILDSAAFKPVITPLSDSRSFIAYNEGTTTIKANDIGSNLTIPDQGVVLNGAAPIPRGAVQFPDNLNILLAWTDGDQVNLTIFDPSVTTSEPVTLDLVNIPVPDYVSITLDRQNRAIVFWTDAATNNLLYYALVDSSGNVVTPPMVFRESGGAYEFIISPNGQGIVGLDGLYAQFMPSIAK